MERLIDLEMTECSILPTAPREAHTHVKVIITNVADSEDFFTITLAQGNIEVTFTGSTGDFKQFMDVITEAILHK